MKLTAMGGEEIINKRLVVHAHRIAFIPTDRFSVPGRIDALRMQGVEINVPDLLVQLRHQYNFIRRLDEINRRYGVEQESRRPHGPAAHLARVAGAARDDFLVLLLQRLSRPWLQDGIRDVSHAEGAGFSAAGRL